MGEGLRGRCLSSSDVRMIARQPEAEECLARYLELTHAASGITLKLLRVDAAPAPVSTERL